jgi:phage terminase large subunit-like protein
VSAALSAPLAEGSQEPRFLSTPPASSYTAAEDALEFLESVGVLLDPWQKLCVRHALAEAEDGRWAAFEFALLVARQNGKGEVIMALELAKLYLFRFGRPPLILHSAHLFPTAQEAFRRIRDVIDGSDVLRKEIKRVSAAHGEEGVELLDGARLRFMARTISGAGRGFSPTDLYLDEVFHLPIESVSANMPALSAQRNPQIGYFCSAGFPDSDVLWRIVERGRAGGDPQLAYLEWSVPRDVDLADPVAWLEANPAVGYRVTLEAVAREYAAMPADEFARERLGIWADMGQGGPIDPEAWRRCRSAEARVGEPWFGIEVESELKSAAIAAAGETADGLPRVALVEKRPGIEWVVARCLELGVTSAAMDADGAAAALVQPLEDAGIWVVPMRTPDAVEACLQMQADVIAGRLAHPGDEPLDRAVGLARQRDLGDAGGWVFGRKKSGHDISELQAVAWALWLFRNQEDVTIWRRRR